jgi:diguanylate cyclase (GGDEF)-like protein/PAS domain S-box-containing protein
MGFGGEGQGRPSTAARGVSITADGVARDYPPLLERVPAVIYIADTGEHGRWHYVSPQIEAVLGYSPAHWCANPRLWAERLHAEDREQILKREASSAGDGGAGAQEYRMLHRDGRVVWIRDDAQLVADHDGELRWHGVISDITERKHVEAELEQRAAQQAAVALLGEHALEGASTTELMHEAVVGAARILDVQIAGVAELMHDEGYFLLRAGVGFQDSAIGTLRFPDGTASLAGYTLLTGEPVVVEDSQTERRFGQSWSLEQLGTRSELSVKIQGGRGRPFGVLGVHARSARSFGSGDVDFLQSLANVLADALERQAVEDAIRHRALHDPLTGLPNRVLFLDRLEQALARVRRRHSLAAILFFDLDRFKLVNDSLGHHVGDELLAAAAPRLKQAVRTTDTVARFGGDEFGILLEDISDEHDAIEMAERIASVFARPFVLAGKEHFVTTSIGIALARGGELAADLIRDADAAMYRAKDRGRARYEVFDDGMRARAIARLGVENDLRRAIERRELRLAYQPLVSLGSATIVGVEALLRWQHPERGLIRPSDFIPVAEETGLILPIGNWVLENACRQTARWHAARPDAAPVGLSVNLSAAQVVGHELTDMVASVLGDTGLEPGCLSLEITETAMLTDAGVLTETLESLKALGVRLVLDDLGTGYSSLGYLTHLPLDALKVDRSFVDGLGTEPRDTAITEAIIAMSRALSLEVIAEGVETPLQISELGRLGCDLAQGYYFSPPVSAREISIALRDGPRWNRLAVR